VCGTTDRTATRWRWSEATDQPPRRHHPDNPGGSREAAGEARRCGCRVSLLAYAGLRPGEARGVKWADVGNVLHVRRAVGPEGVKATKTTKTRTVPLASGLRADLDAWRRELGSPPADAFVLSRADGQPWTNDDYRNWSAAASPLPSRRLGSTSLAPTTFGTTLPRSGSRKGATWSRSPRGLVTTRR
jgi:integrase